MQRVGYKSFRTFRSVHIYSYYVDIYDWSSENGVKEKFVSSEQHSLIFTTPYWLKA